MKKNKKLFAILTLVAFMITLMPVMAFAAATDAPTGLSIIAGTGANLGKIKIEATAESTADVGKVIGGTNGAAATVTVGSSKFATDYFTPDAVGTSYTLKTNVSPANADLGTASAAVLYDAAAKGAVDLAIATASAQAEIAFDGTVPTGKISITGGTAGSVIPVVANYTTTITSIDPALKNIVSPVDGKTAAVAADVTGNVTFNVKLTSGNALASTTKTIPVTVKKVAAATPADAKQVLNGSAVTVPGSSTSALFTTPVDSGVTVSIFSYDSTLTAAMVGAVADHTGFTTLAPVANATGTVRLALTKAGITEYAEVTLTIGGGGGGNASNDASIIATADENASVEVDATATMANVSGLKDTKVTDVNLVIREKNNAAVTTPVDVYVWAEETGKSKIGSDALVLNKGTQIVSNGHTVYKVLVTNVETVKAAFVRAGDFTLRASFADPTPGAPNASLTSVSLLKNIAGKTVISAKANAQETRKYKVDVATGDNNVLLEKALTDGNKTAKSVEIAADTVATTKVTLTVNNKNDKLISTYPIKLSTDSENIKLDKTSITTDYKCQASFNIAGLREGNYKVYVNIGDYEATINVQVGATSANDINLIKFPSNPIATDTLVADYADIFRIQLTDANGNIVAKNNPKGALYAAQAAPTSEKSMTDQAKYASVVKAPEANKVKDADLELKYVADKDYYTLNITGNKAFEAEGDYEVRVVLDNGKSVTINFTVKKFEKATSLTVEYPTNTVELNSRTATPDIFFLDANKVMKKANNRVNVVANGYAVATIVPNGKDAGQITVKNDEKYVNETITVVATSDKENLISNTVTLTVAEAKRSVKLDTNRGQVNANNRVGFKILDSKGNAVALGNEVGLNNIDVSAVVTNNGDKDAKVSYSISGTTKSDLMNKGVGVINLTSNKETTATVQILVRVTKNSVTNAPTNNTGLSTAYYSGEETFTFGAEAQKSVVMTIGSKEIVANNVPNATDVAPFIKESRTYVPFRALIEAFGAEVVYDETAQTVTSKLAGKTVVMNVGSNILTVNDKTVTMEGAAPYILDNRVVIPVRFVGEAFGFTVTAIADDATGATSSVVFYQK